MKGSVSKWVPWFILVTVAGVVKTSTETSTVGKDLFFGIPLTPVNQFPEFELRIGTTTSDQANYVVESLTGQISSGTTSSNQFANVSLSSDLEVTSANATQRMKGIRVRATGAAPISVLVVISYPFFDINGAASFLIHPSDNLANQDSYEYFAVSTDYAGQDISDRFSAILLVGNSNETTVSITPTQSVQLPGTGSTLVTVAAGSTHTVTLDTLHTLLISSLSDLTGTRIVSNRPLTVLSGHQCAQVPSTTAFCEPIYVQVPPTITWGQRFLLAPFAGRTSNQFYKLVNARNSTTISYRCLLNSINEGREITSPGSSEILAFIPNSFCYLIASAPIFVVQLGAGFSTDNSGDPAMTIISPTTGYVNSATFLTLSTVANNFISVTVKVQHFCESQIKLDGSHLNCTWTDILDITTDDVVGYGCSASITAGTHVVSHSGENGVLSVVVYGWSSDPALGYAYLPAINLITNEYDINISGVDCPGATTVVAATTSVTIASTPTGNQKVLVPTVAAVVVCCVLVAVFVVVIFTAVVLLKKKRNQEKTTNIQGNEFIVTKENSAYAVAASSHGSNELMVEYEDIIPVTLTGTAEYLEIIPESKGKETIVTGENIAYGLRTGTEFTGSGDYEN